MHLRLGSVALVLLSSSASVWAQGADAPASRGPDGSYDGSEIIVQAQRRSERLQDVPISVTVQTGAQLERAGVDNLRDLATVTPGLTFQAQGNFVQPALRGVTTLVTGPGSDNPISLYIDGVYEGTQAGASIDLPDVERVEVAKGPQGTLFGRNSTGGAIQIFTRAPSFTTTGSISATAGYYDGSGPSRSSYDLGLKGFLSGPIVPDKVAASLSFGYRNVDGYSTNIVQKLLPAPIQKAYGSDRMDWLKSLSLRGKLLFTPSDGVSILLTGYYMHRKTDHGSAGLPVDGLTAGAFYPDAVYGRRPFQYAYDAPDPLTEIKNYGGAAKIDIDTGAGTLTSTTSYTRSRHREQVDVDASYSPQCLAAAPTTFACIAFEDTQPNNNFLQDFLFTSEQIGRLKFVAGGNYFHSNGDLSGVISDFSGGAQPGAPGVVYGPLLIATTRVKTRAYGIFAQADYNLTDQLTLTAGLRYSYEKKKGYITFFGAPFTNFANPSWDSFTPRVGLRYAIDRSSNVYATFSKGFKSGILPILTPGAPVNPEKITAYEVGYKTARPGYSLNLAAYLYDYKDLQIQSFTGTTIIPTNAASARIYGFEFDGTFRITPELTLAGGASWMPKADFRRFPNAAGYQPVITAGGLPPVVADVSGHRLVRAPKLSAVGSLTYATRMGDGELSITPSIHYSSSFMPYDAFNLLVQHSYAKVAAEIAYKPNGGGLRYSVWAHNLTNSKSFSSTTISAGAARASYEEPREFGITVGYDF
ncbi:TonB-dependent receptor [Rhizorhabdus histidinilytica]|jgi:iron complex outermembrane receptor protein|uniref:Iron complex outermembrane recepter protein n=1 Tax=Rhizorhabdus histidinilytica TaxID=439228 RepID=A0A1T5GTE7_9SPHN|nr:TonB-dependent receptor [Rhizorhabdus histidinilytica]SKC11590.1 iron complex outermembrane recepter protein [Rhizorhabdus histidinilytica]